MLAIYWNGAVLHENEIIVALDAYGDVKPGVQWDAKLQCLHIAI